MDPECRIPTQRLPAKQLAKPLVTCPAGRFFLRLYSLSGISRVSARSSMASPVIKQPETRQTMNLQSHETYMRLAIAAAANAPEPPSGAVIVEQTSGKVLAIGFNHISDNPVFCGEIDAINRKMLNFLHRSNLNLINRYKSSEG